MPDLQTRIPRNYLKKSQSEAVRKDPRSGEAAAVPGHPNLHSGPAHHRLGYAGSMAFAAVPEHGTPILSVSRIHSSDTQLEPDLSTPWLCFYLVWRFMFNSMCG